MGDIDDVFVGTDTIVRWNFKIRELVAFACQPPTGVRGSDNGALLLGPLEGVEAERRPVVFGVAAGIHLVFELEEAKVAALMRAEAGDFDVVSEEIRMLGDFVVLAGEEFFLVIEAWSPSEVGADFQSSPRMCRIMSGA